MAVTAISLVCSRSGIIRADDARATSKLAWLASSGSAARIRSTQSAAGASGTRSGSGK